MAYYTGTVNSFADLKAVIEGAAVDTGWTLISGILSKYGHFIQLATGTNGGYPFLSINAATGQSGGDLSGQVAAGAKMYSSKNMVLAWPGEYFIHAFDREFYCFLKSNVDLYQTLTFGVSDMPGIGGTGGWYGSMAWINRNQNSSQNRDHILNFYTQNQEIAVGAIYLENQGYLSSPFWATKVSAGTDRISEINIGLESNGWVFSGNRGISAVAGLLTAAPSLLNSGHILLPVKNIVTRIGGGVTNVLQHEHLRWIRNDLIDNEEIIEYGMDRWKCYPVLRKNLNERNGNTASISGGFTHSGTYGYAVRYDGP